MARIAAAFAIGATVAGLAGTGVAGIATRNLVVGTSGPDTLLGTKGPDLIAGAAGHDELYGGAGADVLRGGPGKDHLYGGDGADVLSGGPADDPWPVDPPYRRERLLGGSGNDVLVSRLGGAVLMGGRGDDTIDGRGRTTRCRVRLGGRALASGGPPCVQWLMGGRGRDIVRARDGNADMIQCGGGFDRVASADALDYVAPDCERSVR